MAQLYACDLDGFEEGTSTAPINVWFYSLKTKQGLWSCLSLIPLSRSRLRKGLHLSVAEAARRSRSCCAVTALAEIRRSMLPVLRKQKTLSLQRKRVYGKKFFPFKRDVPEMLLEKGGEFRYIAAGTMNGLLATIISAWKGCRHLAKAAIPDIIGMSRSPQCILWERRTRRRCSAPTQRTRRFIKKPTRLPM